MAAKLPLPRQRLSGPRVAGLVVEWKGTFGWVQPDAPVNHVLNARNGGRVYMAATDVQNGLIPHQGLRVDFAAYSDASGIGAQQVRAVGGGKGLAQQKQQPHQPSQVKGVVKTIQKSKFQPAAKAPPGKHGGGQTSMVPQPKFQPAPFQKPGGKGGRQASVKAAGLEPFAPMTPKAKVAPGKQVKIWSGAARATAAAAAGSKATANSTKAGKQVRAEEVAERTPVQGNRWFTGVVTQFFGRFGWIKPDTKILHPKADAHKGLLYCHVDSAAPSCTEIVKGMAVKFRAYSDVNGLGAQDIQDKFGNVTPAPKVAAAPLASVSSGKGASSKGMSSKGGAKGKSSKGSTAAPKAAPKAATQAAPKAAPKALPVQKTIQKRGPSSQSQAPAGSSGAGKGGKGKTKSPLAQATKTEARWSPAGVAAAGAHGKSKGKGKGVASAAAASTGTSASGSKGAVSKGSGAKGAGKVAGKASGKGSGSALQQPAMPPNWEEHWSDEHAVPYFWNRVTKESRWIRPSK